MACLFVRTQELLPQVKAILILDEDGGRVSCKYHDKNMFPNLGAEAMFEHKLFRKTKSVSFKFAMRCDVIRSPPTYVRKSPYSDPYIHTSVYAPLYVVGKQRLVGRPAGVCCVMVVIHAPVLRRKRLRSGF